MRSARRNWVLGLIYLSEGAPIGFIWWALPPMLVSRGVPVSEVALLTALVALPWSLKFLLAPFVDALNFLRARYAAQVIFANFMMGLTLLGCIRIFTEDFQIQELKWLLLTHALFAAWQDVAIDAYAVRTVDSNDMGKANAFMQLGMILGRSLFGGAGVFLADHLGAPVFLSLLVGFIWTIAIVFGSLTLPSLKRRLVETKDVAGIKPQVTRYFGDIWQCTGSVNFWLLVLLSFTVGLSYEGTAGIASAKLKSMGFPSHLQALLYSFVVPVATAAGAFLGGWGIDRFNEKRLLVLVVGICSALSVVSQVGFSIGWPPLTILVSFAAFYILIGAVTTTQYAFLMRRTVQTLAAFQFSLFMSVTNLCESFATSIMGWADGAGLSLYIALGLSGSAFVLTIFTLRFLPVRFVANSG